MTVEVEVVAVGDRPWRDELLELYEAVGWHAYTVSPDVLVSAVRESPFVATARDEGRLVGLVRAVSDDATIAYLQDVLVAPSHQRQGVGRQLVEAFVARYAHVRQRVLLTDDLPEQATFYEGLGFTRADLVERGVLRAFVDLGQITPSGAPVLDAPTSRSFVEHYRTARGRVRLALLREQVAEHLPPGSRVLDVGGGAGHLAAQLAREGHEVVLIEPSPAMREAATDVIRRADVEVRVEAEDVSSVPGRDDAGTFDAVLCHASAPHVDDLDQLVADVVAAVRPGGLVSIVVKNRDAMAMRPALEQRWRDVPTAIGADGDVGRLGVRTRAHTRTEVVEALADHECETIAWWGVRVGSDGLPADATPDLQTLVAAERVLGSTDPYRALGRLVHVLARRGG